MVRFELVVRGGRCVLPWGVASVDLGVNEGRICAVGNVPMDAGERELDARHLHVLPGVIDSQVHFREPGLEHKEDFQTGTAAAALGGVTTVLEMPNTNPPTTNAAALADKVRRLAGRAWVDAAFFVGATAENAHELGALEVLPGAAGVKVFMGSSTGTLLVRDDEQLARVLASGRRRVAIHAEDEERLSERRHLALGGAPATHPVWRDELTSLMATTRCLRAARRAGRPVHLLHVTTADELDVLARNRDLASVEVTPQHLTLQAPECYRELGSRAQMNPRSETHGTAKPSGRRSARGSWT
jgi:dihydroorotase